MKEKLSANNPLIRIDTKEFVDTGLIWLINSYLHLMGFALSYHVDEKTGEYSDFYICRTIFRGFEEPYESEGYEHVARFLKDNAARLYAEGNYPTPGEDEDRKDFAGNGANGPLLPR